MFIYLLAYLGAFMSVKPFIRESICVLCLSAVLKASLFCCCINTRLQLRLLRGVYPTKLCGLSRGKTCSICLFGEHLRLLEYTRCCGLQLYGVDWTSHAKMGLALEGPHYRYMHVCHLYIILSFCMHGPPKSVAIIKYGKALLVTCHYICASSRLLRPNNVLSTA